MPPTINKRAVIIPSSVETATLFPSTTRALTRPLSRRSSTALYGLTIFLSAFLLFQVELILGKFVLPRFGGGPSVWSTSLLTFQLLLFAGYGYAAILTQRFDRRTQSRIHAGLLSLSALAIAAMAVKWHSPILPLSMVAPAPDASPVFQIALLLITAVGIPCILLSASSPLLQSWYSDQSAGASPYRFYALSNLGSMLGLLSYPFLVERLLRLSTQAWLWTVFYVIFLVTTAICALSQVEQTRSAPTRVPVRKNKSKDEPPPRPQLVWLALSTCGSVMLLATTNLICQEVAVIPLLWVLPLSLYLLSFIICFDHARWYRREVFHPLYLALALLSLRMLFMFTDMTNPWPLATFCSALFAVCMVCHGELARLKPEPQHLTSFYLMISLGGVLGSAFVVLVAPHVFTRFWEFHIALIGCGGLLALVLVRDPKSWLHQLRAGVLVFAAGALVFVVGAFVYTSTFRKGEDVGDTIVWRARNFFGVKAVLRYESTSILRHGRTVHGVQNADPMVRREPTMYYSRNSGIGVLLENFPIRMVGAPVHLGVIGMGAGTLAAYGQAGDFLRFYEIDPDVVGLSQGANPYFTFVKDSPASIDIAIGDARIELQQELAHSPDQKFEILVVDAFSGDAVPVHLLTREAMGIYLEHLRGPRSVVAFHISNRSIDLRPVVAGLAQEYHLASLEIDPRGVGDWILLARDSSILEFPPIAAAGHPIELTQPAVLWTDDYSNVYSLIQGW